MSRKRGRQETSPVNVECPNFKKTIYTKRWDLQSNNGSTTKGQYRSTVVSDSTGQKIGNMSHIDKNFTDNIYPDFVKEEPLDSGCDTMLQTGSSPLLTASYSDNAAAKEEPSDSGFHAAVHSGRSLQRSLNLINDFENSVVKEEQLDSRFKDDSCTGKFSQLKENFTDCFDIKEEPLDSGYDVAMNSGSSPQLNMNLLGNDVTKEEQLDSGYDTMLHTKYFSQLNENYTDDVNDQIVKEEPLDSDYLQNDGNSTELQSRRSCNLYSNKGSQPSRRYTNENGQYDNRNTIGNSQLNSSFEDPITDYALFPPSPVEEEHFVFNSSAKNGRSTHFLPKNHNTRDNSGGECSSKSEQYLTQSRNHLLPEENPSLQYFNSPCWELTNEQLLDRDIKEEIVDEDDEQLNLGSSLFVNRRDSFEFESQSSKQNAFPKISMKCNKYVPYNVLDDNTKEENNSVKFDKKTPPATLIRKNIDDFFSKNKHPTAQEILQLAQEYRIKYVTVFEMLEKKRKSEKIVCHEGDPCNRIKDFFVRENELLNETIVTEDVRRLMEHEIETHILSRQRFTVGHLHCVLEKTNLPPGYVRGQFESWKKKLLTKDYRISDYKRDTDKDQATHSIETLRKLESAYLAKKYQCSHNVWSPKEIKSLAADLKISERAVSQWIDKRQSTNLGLNDDVIKLRRENEKTQMMTGTRKLPQWKVQELENAFKLNNKMNVEQRARLADKLELTERQVTNYLNKKRIFEKRNGDFSAARSEIQRLSHEKKKQLEKALSATNLTAHRCEDLAKQLGVSVQALIQLMKFQKRQSQKV